VSECVKLWSDRKNRESEMNEAAERHCATKGQTFHCRASELRVGNSRRAGRAVTQRDGRRIGEALATTSCSRRDRSGHQRAEYSGQRIIKPEDYNQKRQESPPSPERALQLQR
jgi:hypothetical protein